MNRNLAFTFFLIAILFGIAIFSLFGISLYLLLAFGAIGVFLIVISFSYRFVQAYVIWIIVGIILGLFRSYYEYTALGYKVDIIDSYASQKQDISYEIRALYKQNSDYRSYKVYLRHVGQQELKKPLAGIIQIPSNYRPSFGELYQSEARIGVFEDFDGFSYRKYMASQKLYFSARIYELEEIGNESYPIRERLSLWRTRLLEQIDYLYPREQGLFLAGILLGAREGLGDDLENAFNNSGLTHFIAVSGFNISLCVALFSYLFAFTPRVFRICIVGVGVVAFSVFVGLGAPVVRAAIMGILGYIFLLSGVSVRSLTLLLFSAALMLLYSPLGLLYDMSFQLSFLAVLGIMYTQNFFGRYLSWLPNTLALRESLVLTLGASVFTFPILFFGFGVFPLLSPITNILVGWTIPLGMLLGAISLLLSSISDLLGFVVGYFCYLLLSFDVFVAMLFSGFEWSILHYDFGPLKYVLQSLYLLILAYVLTLAYIRTKKQP